MMLLSGGMIFKTHILLVIYCGMIFTGLLIFMKIGQLMQSWRLYYLHAYRLWTHWGSTT
jgi:hypothetical protein